MSNSSMNYKGRTTGDPEPFSKDKKAFPEVEIPDVEGQHGRPSYTLGALMGPRAVRAHEQAGD
eukprot:7488162-Prorocentrum_lima.AAC.1